MKDKIKPIFLFVAGCFLLLFFTTYLLSISGYYEGIKNSRVIPAESLERFEKDVLNEEKIVASNYITKQETYDNFLSRMCIRIGDFIASLFRKIMGTFMREINRAID